MFLKQGLWKKNKSENLVKFEETIEKKLTKNLCVSYLVKRKMYPLLVVSPLFVLKLKP